MDQSEIDALVQRLVANPHDEEALQYAHEAGASDPKSYAFLLEKVGTETRDPAYASHWLSEAANVWSTALGDAHRAARVLMMAIDKDPTQRVAAERLAQLYRDKGDVKALVALLDRRAKALGPMAISNPEIRSELAGMHEELGRLWSEPPLTQPKKAVDAYRRAVELDPQSQYAIFNLRELLKAQGLWDEAFQMYAAELALEGDPARRTALLRDEAISRKSAGDLEGATRALAMARQVDDGDPALQQEYAASVLDRIQAGERVPESERRHAAELLVALAEVYDGEHGFAYAGAGLDVEPGHDRALQLHMYYARIIGREEGLTPRYEAYLQANPEGVMHADARHALAATYQQTGDYRGAVSVLEPLRAAGDNEAAAKIQELYPHAQNQPEKPAPAPQAQARGAGASQRPEPPAFAASSSESGSKKGPLSPDKLQGVLDAAQMLAGKGKKAEAFAKYKEALEADPAHPEALAWVEDYLRTKRDYGQLRDVLLASVRQMGSISDSPIGGRKERLREIAGLCEGNLRDTDGAINAWKQLLALDRGDGAARQSLTRLLEKSQRWDDLASLLEQEATAEHDVETKIALEKKLASLQETKRKDLFAAADAWARIANLTPDDAAATQTASKLYEKADRLDLASQVIADNAASIDDPVARGNLYERLGEIREQMSDLAGAGDAFASAADTMKSPKLWESAERCFTTGEKWDKAASATVQRAQLMSADPKLQAQLYARAADLFGKAGDTASQLARIEQATDLDPVADEYATVLVDRYTADDAWDKLAAYLSKRGDRLTDCTKRVGLRTQAATIYANKLQDREASREQWLKVLEDGDDREALEKLVDYAVEREDHTEAATLLRRLGNIAVDKADKARVALREAELLAEGVGDIDTAIGTYEQILAELDPTCRPALQAIADLQEARENLTAAADALERELKLVADPVERGQIAARLARLYESLDDPKSAIRALDVVRKADLEDFDALTRLCELCEKTEQWDRVAELLTQRIEVEADEAETSVMTKRLADILATKLDRGDEALAALTELADLGDAAIREAYVELGDRLGWKGIVAQKMVEWWFEARQGQERTTNLRAAFERFCEVGRDQDAARVAIEIVRSKGADRALAERLEELAVKTADHEALSIAHEILSRELAGPDRANELVRQAEVRVKAGMPRSEALQHGEAGLTSVSPGDAEPLLERLAAIATKPYDIVDLYERQVSRCKAAADCVRALARAAQVAGAKAAIDRARGFFELALTGSPSDETLALLEQTAREGDRATGGEKLRRALCTAMSQGGQGARDGGRTRGALLRRAASMANRDLNDVEQAFAWLGAALVAHVDNMTLDALDGLGQEVGDPRRSEGALTHALSEVFDGPLVRQLLARRAKIRADQMEDKPGAAADLKKLHDLSPNDQDVMEELSSLLTALGDYRGMVQLYEDQILRGKDMTARADLARKVARMWEEQLQDPREAADAWRRVLRMKQGDDEATQGLERAKQNLLKKPDANAPDAYAPPKMGANSGSMPVAPAKARGSASMPASSAVPTARNPGETTGSITTSAIAAPPESEKPSSTFETAAPEHQAERSPISEPAPPTQNDPSSAAAPIPRTSDDTHEGPLSSHDEPTHDRPKDEDERDSTEPTPLDEPKPTRPRDLWFRSSQDEVTMSAHTESPLEASQTATHAGEDDHRPMTSLTSDVEELLTTPGLPLEERDSDTSIAEDFSRTNEVSTVGEFLDSTNARSHAARVPPAAHSDHEVIDADELADLIDHDVEEDIHVEAEPPEPEESKRASDPPKSRRTLPPPLPRN